MCGSQPAFSVRHIRDIQGDIEMEIGGLMAEAFAIYLGNPDVMLVIFGWGFLVTILLTVLELYRRG